MDDDKRRNYFMVLEEYPANGGKVRFSKIVKVREYEPMKKTSTEGTKLADLRENAKKLEGIDGGIKPSNNVYRARINLEGVLIDLKSGKSLLIPPSRLKLIESEVGTTRRSSANTTSFLPKLKKSAGSKSVSITKKKMIFDSLNRINRRYR